MINVVGKRAPQAGLFEADTLYAEFVGRDSFYGFLAGQRGRLFDDAAFAALYCPDNGRNSVPPSLLATALILQTYEGVSDEEARQRATYDLRWKVALGIELEAQPFAKSTLQEFRARLVAHKESRAVFEASLRLARQQGVLKARRKLKIALDTTNILGRGAVKDTYNLLADGIVRVLRLLAAQAGQPLTAWASSQGYECYVSGPSLKGQAGIDWDNAAERQRFLAQIVADADRLLEQVRQACRQLRASSDEAVALRDAAGVLSRVLAQDIDRQPGGPVIKPEVTPDRLLSVHDPDMRHGHKSKSKRFDGHKAQVAVDTDSQLIVAVDVLPGNAADAEQALAMVKQTEKNTHRRVAETIGDCAYGAGDTREAFADAGRTLVAKVPASTNHGCYPKTAFSIDVEAGSCTCPAGQVTTCLRTKQRAQGHRRQEFQFAAAVCQVCPLRASCTRGTRGRSVQLHPQEALLLAARLLQAGPAFAVYRRLRQAAEHRLARLVQLGIRQARYRGRTKTLFQLLLAAAVANLTLLASNAQGQGSVTLAVAAVLALAGLCVSPIITHSVPGQRTRHLPELRSPWRTFAPFHLGQPSYIENVTSRPDF